MDPISASLLVAAATGAGSELGRQLWDALAGLVRRTPADQVTGPTAPATGEVELAALSEAPHDVERARVLSEVLSRRAEQDPVFRADVMQWQQQARTLGTGGGETMNTVSGGSQSGPVVQGRDFYGVHFHAPSRE